MLHVASLELELDFCLVSFVLFFAFTTCSVVTLLITVAAIREKIGFMSRDDEIIVRGVFVGILLF
jgi:hypothetical protein